MKEKENLQSLQNDHKQFPPGMSKLFQNQQLFLGCLMLQTQLDQLAEVAHWQKCFAGLDCNETWKFEIKLVKTFAELAFKISKNINTTVD